jgi:hypothetical protein
MFELNKHSTHVVKLHKSGMEVPASPTKIGFRSLRDPILLETKLPHKIKNSVELHEKLLWTINTLRSS